MDRRRAVTRAGLLTLSLAAACSSGPVEISNQPLAGVIGGAAWTLASAESNAFLSANSPTFFVSAYGQALTACTGGGSAANGNRLILNIPKTAGDYPLSDTLNQTFYVAAGSTNYVTTQGRVVVDEVTTTTIRAQAHFRFDDANQVDGHFAVTICP
jgi:hypothetical protein